MELINGSYKALEKEFLDYFGKVKKDPLEKVLIITQSARLSQRLKEQLLSSRECVACVFWQDILGLVSNINQASDNYIPLKQKSALDYFKLKDFLQKYNLNTSAGFIKALQASFMDMQNALIMPQDLLKIKEYDETLYTEELKELIFIYQNYLKLTAQTDKSSYKDFFTSALENIENNKYLSQFKQIIFYGIYDWTNLQYDILKAISQAYPTALFFPYEEIPSYKYIQDFYLANILGLCGKHKKVQNALTPTEEFCTHLFETSGREQKSVCPNLKIIDTAGILSQVQSAAKEVLLLHKQGFEFKDIAVCARSLEPFQNDLIRVFQQNDIPLNINLQESLLSRPLISFCFNLLSVVRNNFHKDSILSFITSSYLKNAQEQWPQIIKDIGVQTGFAQWQNLLDIAIKQGNYAAQTLKDFLIKLEKEVSLLEEAASFTSLVLRVKKIFNDFINFDILNTEEQNLFTLLENILDELSSFDKVRSCSKGEFLEEFTYLMEQEKINVVVNLQNSLTIADIMNLRGQSFKAIILLGVNEGFFPVGISEDPVFKDSWRSILQRLGYNIKLSVQRYQEEKLFFYFALSAASDKLILTYQRCDDAGKVKVASIYLNWILKLIGKAETLSLSKRPEEQLLTWYKIAPELLSQQEAALLSSFKGDYRLAAKLVQSEDEEPFLQAFSFSLTGVLGDHDLICQSKGPIWKHINQKGLSPSALGKLYLCPAQYLFDNILKREDISVLQRDNLDSRDKGNLAHKILEQFYKHLSKNNLFDKLFAGGSLNILQDFIDKNLLEQDYKKYGLYPLLWVSYCKNIEKELKDFVVTDLKNIQETKKFPDYFEEHIFADLGPFKIQGKIDRVDVAGDKSCFNVVDYKSGSKKKDSITTLIFQKGFFQGPIYFELAKTLENLKNSRPDKMIYSFIKENDIKDLTYDNYLTFKEKFFEIIYYLKSLIEEGFFVITPNEEETCKYCSFKDICRKNHSATERRASLSAQAGKLRGYRKK